jgi:ribosomal protein S19
MSNSIFIQNIVYGSTWIRAMTILDNMVGNIDNNKIQSIKKGQCTYEVILKDGTKYIALKVGDYCRGYRYNKAYVDWMIDREIFDNVIKPCVIHSTLPENEKIEFIFLEKTEILY